MFAIGIFVNMMLVSIFPYQYLDQTEANLLISEGELQYNMDNNPYLSEKQSEAAAQYRDITNDDEMNKLTDTDGDIVSGAIDAISSFFDGALDAITKIKKYIAFIIPFSSMFFLLPGAFGLIMGTMYSMMFAFAIIRWIRDV